MGASECRERARSIAALMPGLLASFLLALSTSGQNDNSRIIPDTAVWMDTVRHRAIPVAIYGHTDRITGRPRPVLLSHGYNENLSGTYLNYSYIAEHLAARGYVVVSIQHELPGDAPLAMRGDLARLRRPNWERGADNIRFVLSELERRFPVLDIKNTTLIGHSNGGDMSVLFALTDTGRVADLITLDNRRLALPRSSGLRVLSLRSSDVPADAGVLPTDEEAVRSGMRIVPLADIKHNEMSNRASAAQRKTILAVITSFLQDR
jgi:pimeloyl-ACP methyl ester carboxylesterase